MINREEYELYNKYRSDKIFSDNIYAICWACRRAIKHSESKFWIAHGPPSGKMSDNEFLYFHRDCFEMIAGQEWIVEPK